MKKLVIGALALLCIATSCSYRVYTVNALRANYTQGMQTPEELEAKEGVRIFLSEQEVPGNYNIIAFAESRPVLPVAIQSQQLKNFYKQAVLKAKELGGDAIIVTAVGQFKVIKFTGTTTRPAPPRRAPAVREEPKPRPESIREEDKTEQAAPAANGYRRSARDLFKTPARSSDAATEKAPSTTTSKTSKSAATTHKAPVTSTKPAKTEKTAAAAAATTAAAATAASATSNKGTSSSAKATSSSTKAAKTEPAAKSAATSKPTTATTPATKTVETPAAKPVASAAERAAIFDESTLQWFTSGYVYRAKEQEQVEIIETMNNEIRDNIAICQTRTEAEFIMTKVDQLEQYNKALPIPSGTQSNKIKGYRNALDKIMGMEEEKPQKKSGAFDNAVQSVKGFFGKLKKK